MIELPNKATLVSIVSPFSSGSTLVCCALPALLVALGAGAALSSLVSIFPQLIWLSLHKVPLFIVVAVVLALSGYLQWRARLEPCPTDVTLARACGNARKISLVVYVVSVLIFVVGGFFAFIAPLIL